MRAVRRSLVVVPSVLLLVVAMPAYAGDDSPGLLDTLGKTVDSITAPLTPQPKASPVAPPKPAGPVKQLVTIVDNALGGQTSLSESPLVSGVDSVLSGSSLPATPQQVTDEVITDPVVELVAPSSSQLAEQVVASPSHSSAFALVDISAASAARPAKVIPAATDESHIPGTSTLPDGGSPLTPTWLLLWVGVTAAGAVVVRRARTSN